jgi:hypothetical protein
METKLDFYLSEFFEKKLREEAESGSQFNFDIAPLGVHLGLLTKWRMSGDVCCCG